MQNVVGEMVVRVGVDTLGLDKGLAAGQSKMKTFATGMGQMGKAMMMGFTLPIAAAGVAVTKMAMDFETEMTNIYTIMDDATIKSQDWGAAVLDMSKALGQTSGDMAEGLYEIISSGFEAGDALIILEASAKAATAGLSDTATSVSAVTAVLNAYNLKASDSKRISDVLFATVKYGVVTYPELASAVGRVISTAAAANVSFEEVGAAIAQMTLSGISADEAVTALNQVILNFLSPTDQAKDAAAAVGFKLDAVTLSTMGLGGAMADLIEKMGLSVDDMVELERQGYSEEEMFDVLAVKSGLTAEAFAAIFSNVRALKGALSLATNEGKNYTEMQDKMADSAGLTEEAFDKQAKTTKFAFNQAVASIKAAGIELGSVFLPIASRALNKISDLADGFADMSEETQNSMLAWAGLLAFTPLLLVGLSKVITAVIGIKAGLAGMNTMILGSPALMKLASMFGVAASAAGSMVTVGGPAIGWFADITGVATTASEEFKSFNNVLKGLSIQSQFMWREWEPEGGVAGGGTWTQKYANDIRALMAQLATASPEVKTRALEMMEAFKQTPMVSADLEQLAADLSTLITTTDAQSTSMQNNTESIMAYRFANEDLISTFSALQGELNNGLITAEVYDQAVQYLADTHGEFKGSIVDVYQALGIMSDEQLGLAETIPETTTVLNDQLDVVVDLSVAFNDLLATLFQLYNLNQSVTESGWAYEDSLKTLDETLKNHASTEREVQEAIFGVQNAREDYIGSILAEAGAEDVSASRRAELIALYVQLGLAAIEAGETSSTKFLEIAKAAGITKTELTTAIDTIGTAVDKIPKEIKAETTIVDEQAKTAMLGMFGSFTAFEESDPTAVVAADTKPADQSMDNLSLLMLAYEKENPTTRVYADTSSAWSAINQLSQYQIPAKTIPLKYGIPGLGFAHGGQVPGPAGVPRPAIVHGGEYVVNPFEPKSVNSFIDAMSGGKQVQPGTIINKFEIAQLTVREDADVTKIARELLEMQMQEQRSLGK